MKKAFACLLGCVVLAGCGFAPAAPLADARGGPASAQGSTAGLLTRGAVLLVHGHNGSADDWATLAPWLAAEGWRPKPITLATDDWDVARLSEQVGVYVEALARESGQAQVDVVAHSLGGLAVRHYIKHHGGDRRIRRLVTLGSPHHGIGYAAAGRWLKVAKLLTPRGSFLNGLNRPDETPGTVTYTSIWSTGDYTQWAPFASGRLVGAFNVRTSGTSHSGMLTDRKLFPAIAEGLMVTPGAEPGPERTID